MRSLTLQNKFLLFIILFLIISWLLIIHYKLIESNREHLQAGKKFSNKSPNTIIENFKNLTSMSFIKNNNNKLDKINEISIRQFPVVKRKEGVLHGL